MNSRSKISQYPEEIPINFIKYSEIIGALKPFLNVSRLFAVPGFSVIGNTVSIGGSCTLFSFFAIFLIGNQLFLLVLRLMRGEDFVRISGPDVFMRVHVICVLFWSLLYSAKFSEALKNSLPVEKRINKVYNSPDIEFIPPWKLRRQGILWTVVFVVLAVTVSLKQFLIDMFLEERSFASIWASYGVEKCALGISTFLPPIISNCYCLVMSIISNFLWLLPDFLVLQVSLVLEAFFDRVNKKGIDKIEPEKLSSVEIDLVREHHGLLSKLVKDFDNALSSLIFINVLLNSAYIISGVYSIVTIRRRDERTMASRVLNLSCKLIVVVFKFSAGMIGASLVNHKAHDRISEVRSWPMTKEYNDFSLNNGRASVIQAFLNQLSYPSIAFTLGKFTSVTAKFLAMTVLIIVGFSAFARITISSCSRRFG